MSKESSGMGLLTQYTEEQLAELKLIFEGVCEAHKKSEEGKSQVKTYNESKRDMIKTMCEKLDISPRIFNKVFKDYMESIEQPEVATEKNSVMAFFLTFFPPKEDKKDD